MPNERDTIVDFEVPRPPWLKESSIKFFTLAKSAGSSNTVGNVFLLFITLGAAVVKSRMKNWGGGPNNDSTVRTAVDFPTLL